MSTGLILGFGLVGRLIAFAVSFSAVSVEYGLIRFFRDDQWNRHGGGRIYGSGDSICG